MPEFCSFFGRYLVCYRVQSEERGGKLHCDFLPDIPAPVTTIAGAATEKKGETHGRKAAGVSLELNSLDSSGLVQSLWHCEESLRCCCWGW